MIFLLSPEPQNITGIWTAPTTLTQIGLVLSMTALVLTIMMALYTNALIIPKRIDSEMEPNMRVRLQAIRKSISHGTTQKKTEPTLITKQPNIYLKHPTLRTDTSCIETQRIAHS